MIFRIFIQSRRIAGLGEFDPAGCAALIFVQFDLIEAIVTPFDNKEIRKSRDVGHVEAG